MGRLEGAYEQISKRLDSIDVRLDRLDAKSDRKFDGVDLKFEGVYRKFDAVRSEMTTQFRSIVALIFGTWITTVLAIFFHR